MNMLVTAIVGSAVSPDLEPESFAGNEAEARLKELAMLIPEAVEAYDALEAKYAAARYEYDAIAPQRPDELRWRPTDPVWIGYDMERLPNKKCRLWCSVVDINRARDEDVKLVSCYQWVGPEDGDCHIKDDDFDDTQVPYAPKPHIAHLYEPKVRDADIKRSAEIIAAYVEYKIACSALEAKLGIDRLLELCNTSADTLYSLYREAADIQTSSLEGLQAKATILLKYGWREGIESDDVEVDDMLRSIVSGLMHQPAPMRQAESASLSGTAHAGSGGVSPGHDSRLTGTDDNWTL